MANLLPHTIQQNIFLRTVARSVIASAILLSLVALMCALALAPAYFTLRTEAAAVAYDLSSLQGTGGASAAANQADVSATNKSLRTLAGLTVAPQISRAIAVALSVKPKPMLVTEISYASGAIAGTTTPSTLMVSGTGANAAAQSSYLDALRREGLFQSADIPISALTHADTSALTVVLTGTF